MDNEKLWLDAADSLVDAYLKPENGVEFDSVAVLSALDHAAHALYWLDYSLYAFIADHTRLWFKTGMTEPACFAAVWQQRNELEGAK